MLSVPLALVSPLAAEPPAKASPGPIDSQDQTKKRPTQAVKPKPSVAANVPENFSESTSTKPKVTIYRVKSGDTLTGIANKFNLTLKELLAVNKIKPSAIIFPGQKITVAKLVPQNMPTEASLLPDRYLVRPGDTLKQISRNFGLSVSFLRQANNLSESSIIYVGQELYLKRGMASVVKDSENLAPLDDRSIHANQEIEEKVGTPAITNPQRPTGACEVHGYHVVKAGESIAKIAAVYAVTTQSVLTENSLAWSNTIYVGQKIKIPGVHDILSCPTLVKLSAESFSNAEVIFRVGKNLGINAFGIVIALATAMQESRLRNIEYGDRDSVGLFQQRPSQGWGKVREIMNPEYSARAFFGGPLGPNAGRIKGLLDIRNWDSLPLSKAAQAVQISAFPDAYAKWELSAWSWLDKLNLRALNNE